MSLEGSFVEKYERLTALKPVAAKLARDKCGRFFWLYYSGMGETGYHELHEIEQELVEELIKKRRFMISSSTVVLTIFGNLDEIDEKQFEVIIKQESVDN